jgi:hypothetical protein
MYIVESADGSPPSMVLVGIVSLFHWMSSFSDDNPDPGGTLSVRETLAEVAAAIGDWGIDSGVGMTVNMVCVACKFIEPPGGYGKWIRGQFGSHAGNSEVYDDVRLGLAVAELAVSLRLTKVPRFSRAACFGAGTLVVTHDGLTPIEEVDIGDLVWARDDETGEEGWKPVVQVVATPDKETLALTFEAADGTVEVVRVTAEHPLWSLDDGGWDEAGHLDLGEQVDALHGPMWLVSAVLLGDTQTVYNLEVADSHTYFVGDVAIWAHNTCWLNIAKHAGKRIPGADLTQKARYLETFANTATGTTTQTGATIWRRGAEILVVRPGVGSGGTYWKADSAKTALRQLQRFIIDNGGAAL